MAGKDTIKWMSGGEYTNRAGVFDRLSFVD